MPNRPAAAYILKNTESGMHAGTTCATTSYELKLKLVRMPHAPGDAAHVHVPTVKLQSSRLGHR